MNDVFMGDTRTRSEKALETRRRNAEARQEMEARKPRSELFYRLRDQVKKTCSDVLNDQEATRSEKLKAAEILSQMLERW